MKKKKVSKMLKIVGLLLPLVIAISWLIFIIASGKSFVAQEGIKMSPVSNSAPIIVSLVIFTIGYVIFLGIMFSEEIKLYLERKKQHTK